jgi:hypothetical protein
MTAIANQRLNNMNQITPDGSLTYEQTGSYQIRDPLNNAMYDLPLMTARQTLSPEQQSIQAQNRRADLNLATFGANQSARADQLLSKPFDVNSLQKGGDPLSIGSANFQNVGRAPTLQDNLGNFGDIVRNPGDSGNITRTYGTDFSSDRQRVENALMERLNPSLDSRRKQLEFSMANKGITMGSEAYKSAMDDLYQGENDARVSAILNAGQEQTRLANLEAQRAGFENSAQMQAYQQKLGNANFQNQSQQQAFQQGMQRNLFGNEVLQQNYDNRMREITADNATALSGQNAQIAKFNALNAARTQALNEAFAVRNQPINEITALLSGANVTNPNFVNPNIAQIANTDYAGIQSDYNRQMFERAKAKSENRLGQFGMVADIGSQLGSSAILASDINIKENLLPIGKIDNGLTVFSYNYKGGALRNIGVIAQEVEQIMPDAVLMINGVKHVDYAKVLQ